MTQGIHSKINVKSSIDKVKQSSHEEYSHQKLLITFKHHLPIMIPITTGNQCMNFFQVKEWELHVRSKFRFNEQQRSILVD